MCGLVTLMCATVCLVLLEMGVEAGMVLQDSTTCVQKCLGRCQELTSPSTADLCCNCSSFCEMSCGHVVLGGHVSEETPFSNDLNSNLGFSDVKSSYPLETRRTLCSRSECKLSDSSWELLLSSCRRCRTKRKPRSPMLRDAAIIARSVGLDLGGTSADPGDAGFSGDSSHEKIVSEKNVVQPRWKVVLESMRKDEGADLVSTSMSWQPLAGPGSWYLMSWQLEGQDGLKGNLLTANTSASLSLELDSLYHLQVTLVATGQSSECLVVDTHCPPPPTYSHLLDALAGLEGAAGGAAACFLFLALTLLLCRTCGCNHKHKTSKDADDLRKYNHFKVYPPPIRLSVDWDQDKPEVQPQLPKL